MVAREGSEPRLVNRTSLERTSDREIVIARTLNGPARIVFDAWTRPELVSRWWAPRSLGVSIVSCDADVRVGGEYRYVLKPDQGDEFAFSGRYTEMAPPSRLAYTAFFESQGRGPMGDPAIVTVTFDERDGRTHVVSRELYPSKEVLDGALATGMERGLRVTMDQLDELVASLV
jgi:uncharacterized protein YndB with AHSA1/START domain